MTPAMVRLLNGACSFLPVILGVDLSLVIGSGPDALLTCRYCGATASSVIALSRIACLAVTVSTT